MKTKLLFALCCIMIAGTLYTNAQQIWAVTPNGGAASGGTIIRMNPDGSGFEVEYSYACSMTAGCMPMGNLMQASNGQLYGSCFLGGQFGSCTVDRYDPTTSTYYDIYDFDITNGDYPYSGLVETHNGKLYGVASSGGTSWVGVLYSINLATNAYTPEYSFNSVNGSTPWACPTLTNSGMLYGLTTSGGTYASGVLYSYNIVSGTYTALHHFSAADGTAPHGGLFEASNGLLYGMTSAGGANGHGTIFSYDAVNNVFTVLYSFTGTLGGAPEGTLMQAANGNLYGVTKMGGVNNAGVIFSYDIAQNMYAKLYDFVVATGSNPTGNLYQAPNMMLYGSASYGGTNNMGVLFSYDLGTNTYTDILEFNGTNGSHPAGGFVMVEMPTGVSPLEAEVFAVYPNPANEEININFAKAAHNTIALRNVTGEILFSAENYSLQTKIDASNLPKGIYFVEVKGQDGKILNKKIVKM